MKLDAFGPAYLANSQGMSARTRALLERF